MTARLDIREASPEGDRAMLALDRHTRSCGPEASLLELVKTRASQINGCAYCVHSHSEEAMRHGETPQRPLLLSAWREAPCTTPREGAALAWTESLTLLAERGAPDALYAEAAARFSPKELVDLTVLVGLIGAWSRLGVGFAMVPRVEDWAG